jgi:hypothetical protein
MGKMETVSNCEQTRNALSTIIDVWFLEGVVDLCKTKRSILALWGGVHYDR